MTRNGLLTLIAVFLALALVVRIGNPALAQGNITYFDYSIDPSMPTQYDLGYLVIIDTGPGGTMVTSHPYGPEPFVPGKTTENHLGTVFMNLGGTSARPSYINAASAGSIVSTTSTAPAIQNGGDTSTPGVHSRMYRIQVTRLSNGQYQLEYGFILWGDPLQVFYPIPPEQLPEELRSNDILDWQDSEVRSVASLPPGINPGFVLAIGESATYGNTTFYPQYTATEEPVRDDEGNLVTIQAPGFLYPIFLVRGSRDSGTLVINQRDERDLKRHRYDGDERTLIESAGTAIKNYGTLTVYDARIIAPEYYEIEDIYGSLRMGVSGVGILIEYGLPTYVGVDEDTLFYGSSSTADSVSLYNTQIGNPGQREPLGFDPITGKLIYGYDRTTGEPIFEPTGIKMDTRIGMPYTPMPTTTRIWARDKILSDGINGRIIAGQNVTMNRNPVGSIGSTDYSYFGIDYGSEAQYTNYDIRGIEGPSIGIHAQVHNEFDWFDPRTFLVYGASTRWFDGYFTSRDGFPQSGPPEGYYDASAISGLQNSNHIMLNDHSWIFANTGISFGDLGMSWRESATRVIVDSTSGIYSPGTGGLDPTPNTAGYYTGILYSLSEEDNDYAYNYFLRATDGYGITDRYSVVALWAYWGNPFDFEDPEYHRVDGDVGYSGSFHEIQIEGKVIVGAPSRAGIELRFPRTYNPNTGTYVLDMSSSDLAKLSNVYYHDPSDPDADRWGNVYYYDPERSEADNERISYKFVAYNTQPNRVFWLKIDGLESVPLTYFDQATQRWTVHPDAETPNVRINSGQYYSADPVPYFRAFDVANGVAIDIVGTSMAYEGNILPEFTDPWSTYYGPTVRLITALGNDALISGGEVRSNGAAMSFGSYAHVAKVIIGENNDVKNLSNVLFSPVDFGQSVKNYQAFDLMTTTKRAKFLYDPTLMYTDGRLTDDENAENFHFDNAGVHGDIVTYYSPVAYLFGGAGPGWETIVEGQWDSFWLHSHPYLHDTPYNEEILGIGWTSGSGLGGLSPAWAAVLQQYGVSYAATSSDVNPSYMLGHRDRIARGSNGNWTASGIPGRSLVLDEVFLNFLQADSGPVPLSFGDSYGYADNPRHFREALARFVHYGSSANAGLSYAELLAGYTRDGTLVVFSNGDIYSGRIYGGGIGDPFISSRGCIDLRFVDGTTIFNRNIIERVNDSHIQQDAGIRVRDVYIEKTGHLLMNDSWFSVNPFQSLTSSSSPDYANRLLIHDVLNEGIVSGNGIFEIAQRRTPGGPVPNSGHGVDYFEGYFINRGILAPGLPGFIGESEWQARELETKAYNNMLKTVSQSSGDMLWQQLMRGVPGGQYGTIEIFGSLWLMDEITRPVYDRSSRFYNTDETIAAGEYHVTIGNDTIKDAFGKYVAAIANATATYDPVTHTYDTSGLKEGEISQEDWKIIAMEKLGIHLAWFSTSAMIDKNTKLPLLNQYEQFEYLTNPKRRAELQRKMLTMVLTSQELRLYDTNAAERARLNKKIFDENNIRLEFTPLDQLLWRYGFSDIVSVHGTIPPYYYSREGWANRVYDQGVVPPSYLTGSGLLGVMQLGGVIQADRIYDLDEDANKKEKQTSFIIIASEVYTDGSVQTITSATSNWVFANVDLLTFKLATEQTAAVLTVIEDPHYYRNRVSTVSDSFNAKSVASTLDKAMLTNPGLAMSFQFGLNSPEVLNDVFRQVANSTRANSIVMNLWSPSDNLFNQIGYGQGGMSTGNRGNIVFRNIQNGQLQQPYGQPAVPPPGHQYAPPMGGQTRGQSPFHRTGSIWGAFTNSTFSMGDDDNSYKYSFYRNGVMIGNEWNLTPSAVIGGVAMLNDGTLSSVGNKVKSTDYCFGLYFVAAPFEQFEVKSYFGGGYQSYKSDRYIRNNDVFIGYRPNCSEDNIFGINDHYDSETRGHSFNYLIEFARPFTINPNFVIRPATGFEYQTLRQNAYTEQKNEGTRTTWSNNGSNVAEYHLAQGAKSGTYGMSYNKMDFCRSLVRLGVNTESYFPSGRGGWRSRLYYVHRLTGDRYPLSEQAFTSGSSGFQVRGADLGTGYVQVGLGSHLWLNRDRTATVFANGDWNFSLVNKGYSMLNLNLGLQQNF